MFVISQIPGGNGGQQAGLFITAAGHSWLFTFTNVYACPLLMCLCEWGSWPCVCISLVAWNIALVPRSGFITLVPFPSFFLTLDKINLTPLVYLTSFATHSGSPPIGCVYQLLLLCAVDDIMPVPNSVPQYWATKRVWHLLILPY